MMTDMLVEITSKIDTADMKSSLVNAMIEVDQKCILGRRTIEFRFLEKDLVIMTVMADVVVTIGEATTEGREVEVK
jgi:hypothetical protein